VAIKDVFMSRFRYSFGPWTFAPGLISSLLTVVIFPSFVYLGLWQLDRWEEKNLQKKQWATRMLAPPLTVSTTLQHIPFKLLRYHSLEVTGTFLNHQQILLDNQILKGQVGYRVLTPLLLKTGTPKILLIDRGWIPIGPHRDKLPILKPILEPVTLRGMIQNIPSGLVLQSKLPEPTPWPLRIQTIDFRLLSKLLGQKLYPFVLQLKSDDAYSFIPILNTTELSAERHLGYAIQWFTMAFAVLIYFFVINSHRNV
jgi:surfeit locus 1 family protein